MDKPKRLEDIYEKLCAPFPPGEEMYRAGPTRWRNRVKWTRPLPYIDARCVYNRLDEVVGPDNWTTRMTKLENGGYICELTVLGITKTDVGMVNTKIDRKTGVVDPDSEIMAEKGSASDALKRAAVQFGIGRYLYDMMLPMVPMVNIGTDGREYWVLADDYRPPHAGGKVFEDAPEAKMDDAGKTDVTIRTGDGAPAMITARQKSLIGEIKGERECETPEARQAIRKFFTDLNLDPKDKESLDKLTFMQGKDLVALLKTFPRKPRRHAMPEEDPFGEYNGLLAGEKTP